jgi:hypothetical protein
MKEPQRAFAACGVLMHNARANNGVPLEKVGAPSVEKLDVDRALKREREGG